MGVFSPPEHPGEAVRAEINTLPDGSRLLVGQVDDRAGFVRTVGSGLIAAVAIILILATAAGISTSRRSVTRIETINAISREIMATGPGRRVPQRGTGDEWDELADNLNAMLGRIEELIETNRQVSNNIAHDLRTPLTRMRGRLEGAWRQPFDAGQYKALVGETIAELDGVLRIFSSLLRISQIEAHQRRAGFRDLDLSALAREVVELFEPLAEEKGSSITLHNGEHVSIPGRPRSFVRRHIQPDRQRTQARQRRCVGWHRGNSKRDHDFGRRPGARHSRGRTGKRAAALLSPRAQPAQHGQRPGPEPGRRRRPPARRRRPDGGQRARASRSSFDFPAPKRRLTVVFLEPALAAAIAMDVGDRRFGRSARARANSAQVAP